MEQVRRRKGMPLSVLAHIQESQRRGATGLMSGGEKGEARAIDSSELDRKCVGRPDGSVRPGGHGIGLRRSG